MTRRILMSSPEFAPALSRERSWTAAAAPLDRGRAHEQWLALRHLVNDHIGPVVDLQAEPWAPAMTFTRDLALVADGVVVPLMPDSIRGPFEAPLARRQLVGLGIGVDPNLELLRFDGGNVLADSHGRLLVGVTTHSPTAEFTAAVRLLERVTGRPAYAVPVAGGRFPHIDMTICDLNGRAWLVYPDALPGFDLDDPDWTDLFQGLPVVTASSADGEILGCNLVVHGDVAIGPEISPELRRSLEDHGVAYIATDLSELLKAGGGAHCLTLELCEDPDAAP